jgi:DNA-binding transcriptional ArsR family regulator
MGLNTSKAVGVLSSLAHDRRLEIFRHLVQAGYEGSTPGAIQKQLLLSPSTLSFHLKSLKNIDLIQVQRDGRSLIYNVNFQLMNETIGYLLENCCSGNQKLLKNGD